MKQPHTNQFNSSSLVRAVLIASCAAGYALSGSAIAAVTDGEIQAQYQSDVARCNAGQTNQNKATCLQEAGAAREEARRNRLTNGNTSFDANQRERCKALPTEKQADCMKLMSDPNATVEGSVGGGGVLREKTMTIPATPTTQGPTNVEGVTGSTGTSGTSGVSGSTGVSTQGSMSGSSSASGSTSSDSQMSAPVPGTGVTK
ncbi:hypothetical protein ACMHYO_10670 [Allopusillimonas ginsengisoli]|uniref:hypothetical protein n=1 Tax=Allopusillimonas ginsengisoli TaxID=453575 RepID=UPI0039C4A529